MSSQTINYHSAGSKFSISTSTKMSRSCYKQTSCTLENETLRLRCNIKYWKWFSRRSYSIPYYQSLFQNKPAVASFFSVIPLVFRKIIFRYKWYGFYGLDTLPATQSVSVSKHWRTKGSDPNQWPGLILPLFTTGLLSPDKWDIASCMSTLWCQNHILASTGHKKWNNL